MYHHIKYKDNFHRNIQLFFLKVKQRERKILFGIKLTEFFCFNPETIKEIPIIVKI